jgi:hypothetical protein
MLTCLTFLSYDLSIYSVLILVGTPRHNDKTNGLENLGRLLAILEFHNSFAIYAADPTEISVDMINTLVQLSSFRFLKLFFNRLWNTLPHTFHSTLFSMFQSSLLISIAIHDACNMPASMFSACPQLKTLYIKRLPQSVTSDIAYMLPTSLPNLHTKGNWLPWTLLKVRVHTVPCKKSRSSTVSTGYK